MNKFILITGALVMGTFLSASASNAGLFQLNEAKIAGEFKQVDKIEQFVNAHPGIQLSEMTSDQDVALLTNANFDRAKAKSFDVARVVSTDNTLLYVLVGIAGLGLICCISYYIFLSSIFTVY